MFVIVVNVVVVVVAVVAVVIMAVAMTHIATDIGGMQQLGLSRADALLELRADGGAFRL